MKTSLKPLLCAGVVALCAGLSTLSAYAGGDLILEIEGIRNAKGYIICVIYTDARGFDSNDPKRVFAAIQIKAKNGRTSIGLHDLPKGPYAFLVFHDANGNGDLDSTSGIPREGYAFSNNLGRKGTPSFKKATIHLNGQQPRRAPVSLIYW